MPSPLVANYALRGLKDYAPRGLTTDVAAALDNIEKHGRSSKKKDAAKAKAWQAAMPALILGVVYVGCLRIPDYQNLVTVPS